jgi:hypothetical protein
MLDNGGHSVLAYISKFFDNEEKPGSAQRREERSREPEHGSYVRHGRERHRHRPWRWPQRSRRIVRRELPAHHGTPTPGAAQAGQYVDPWMSAYKLRSQSLSSGRTFNLSDADSNDMAKVAATEVDQRLKNINPEQYAKQLQGVQDTMLNRMEGGKFASVDDMLNQPASFRRSPAR